MTVRVSCPNCPAVFDVSEEHVGKQAKCRKCQARFLIPGSPAPITGNAIASVGRFLPTTDRQKAFAQELGIQFDPSIDRRALSKLIAEAKERRDQDRLAQLDDLADRESNAFKEIRTELIREIDEEVPRLSTATIEQIMQVLANRKMAGILLTWNPDNPARDDGGLGTVNAAWTEDWIDEEEMREALRMIAQKLCGVSGVTIDQIEEMNQKLERLLDE